MKMLSFIAILVLLAGTACKKKSDGVTSGGFSLPGTWEWVLTTGGIAGLHQTPASTGMHIKYVFKADSTCSVISDTSTYVTTYHIRTDTAFYPGHSTQFLKIGNNLDCVFTHGTDSMWLSEAPVDGFIYTLVKE